MEFHKIFGCMGKMFEVLFLAGIMVEHSKSHFQKQNGQMMCSIICNMGAEKFDERG